MSQYDQVVDSPKPHGRRTNRSCWQVISPRVTIYIQALITTPNNSSYYSLLTTYIPACTRGKFKILYGKYMLLNYLVNYFIVEVFHPNCPPCLAQH